MRCANCGRDAPAGTRFCSFCGSALAPAAPPASSEAASKAVYQKRSPGAAALMVFGICLVISCIAWFPLSLPSRAINAILPDIGCSSFSAGTFLMWLCSAGVGLKVIAVPVALMVVIVLFRKPLAKLVERLTPKLAVGNRFLVAPALATIIFVLTWAGSHYTVTFQVGLFPQIIFPSVVGLFVFAVARFGPSIQRSLSSFFDFRDRFPRWMCLVAAIAIPMLISVVITHQDRVTFAPQKEQFIVLVALITGFLAMTPRSIDLSQIRTGTRVAPKAAGNIGSLVGLAALLYLFQDIFFTDVVLAHDCSCQADCIETSGYQAATGVGGGALGVGAGVIGSSLTGQGPTILDPDGNPRPRWSPGAPPGENGYEGQPGDILVEGNWEDPDYARERMDQLRRRKEELDRKWKDWQRKSDEWLRNRHQQLEAEAAAERQVRQNADDTLERIKGYAKRHGYDDILERAEEVAVNPDGSINVDYVNRLRGVLRNRIGRDIKVPDGKPSTMDWIQDGIAMTSKEIFTGTDADGNTSYSALALRGIVGAVSGGASEFIYTPTDALYRMKDGVDRGESGLKLFGKAVGGALVDELMGRAIGGVLTKGVGFVAKKFPGLTKTVGEYADDIYKKLNKPIGGAKPAAFVGRDGLRLASKKAALRRALDSGDDDAIRALYKNGGMDDLAKLESGGHISPDDALKLNKVISETTDDAVDRGTKVAVDRFQQKNQVKVDEVLVGDSGSSSRSLGTRSVKTDADRTLVPKFDDETLKMYANRTNQTVDEAYDDLARKFTDTHGGAVDDCLKQKGVTATDVDYKSYDRIGPGAGQTDSYPEGFTNARQAQGRTTVHKVDKAGNYEGSYQTSGQTTVDQNQLMKDQFGGKMSPDPTRISPKEMSPLLDQQKASALSHSDPKSLAKAVNRSNYVAGKVGQPLGNPDLVDIAGKIGKNPQQMNSILKHHGLSEGQFVGQAKDMLSNYNPELPT